jgi:hypothetical protein
MNLLFVDPTSPIGHKKYNLGLLNVLKDKFIIDLVIRDNYLNINEEEYNIRNKNIIPNNYIPEIITEKYNNKLLRRFKVRFNQIKLLNLIKKNFLLKDYDLILFSSVEIISFSIIMRNLHDSRVAFIDHGISNAKNSLTKRFFWKNIDRNLEVVVMEDYIKDFLYKDLNIKNKIWTVHHPVLKKVKNESVNNMSSKTIIFAPSLSNDEEFIKNLIKNSSEILNNIIIYIRSKNINYKNENLIVYNKRISKERYNDLFNKCKYVLMPYDNNYNYKTSGVFFEAISFKKPILIRNNNTLVNYKKRYPNIIILFENVDDLLLKQKKIIKENFSNELFSKIIKDYSKDNLKLEIEKMIKEK